MKRSVAIVGQGPNETAWKHGLDAGAGLGKLPESYAEAYCARVAITGRVGEKLAELADVERLRFYASVGRFNLNARFNGKSGKGDKFDREEAKAKAAELLKTDFRYFVLLGGEVAKAFGLSGAPLEVRFDKATERNFLLFPHPSGINQFWNETFNVYRAKKRLKEFLAAAQNGTPVLKLKSS